MSHAEFYRDGNYFHFELCDEIDHSIVLGNVTGGINFVSQIVIDGRKLIKHEPPVHPRVPCQIMLHR